MVRVATIVGSRVFIKKNVEAGDNDLLAVLGLQLLRRLAENLFCGELQETHVIDHVRLNHLDELLPLLLRKVVPELRLGR